MNRLKKIYFGVHPLTWLDVPPGDPQRREKWWEQWPGRCNLGYSVGLQKKPRYEELIRNAREDEGIFFIPSGAKATDELIDLARRVFGPRCVVLKLIGDIDHYRQELGPEFVKGLEEDRRKADENRGPDWEDPSLPPGAEFETWIKTKAWAIDLNRQLEGQGYAYDPANVEFVGFGGDWCYCTATFCIHMSRAFGLTTPIERRFDLIEPSASPLLMKATLVDQNLRMPENIRLFILKAPNEGPAWGNYVAQFWEGIYGPMDRPHVVEVEFPPGSVTEIDIFGWGIGRARGIGGDSRASWAMGVGCGGSTPYNATLVMADESLSLDDFRAALLAGVVRER